MKGKKILLGLTGSIAAYKSAVLARELMRAGAEVRVVMSPAATDFITPLTMSTLTGHPVQSDFTEDKNAGRWTNHVDTALWADLILIAPASANTLAKMASGACDNFLMAVILSARSPVWVAPAMDVDMLGNAATEANLKTLSERGIHILESTAGPLASGLTGKGRMAEPEHIVTMISDWSAKRTPLFGKRVLITAGPTYEAIDPVRFIGNRSTGKMGFCLAEEFAVNGAEVVLVSGPVALTINHPSVTRIDVESGSEMAAAVKEKLNICDAAIFTAAVADFKPVHAELAKIKKDDFDGTLKMINTEDILAFAGRNKRKGQVIVGFALETNDAVANAKKKLYEKNADLLVLNDLGIKGSGFGVDTNQIQIFNRKGEIFSFEMKSKREVAVDIVHHIMKMMTA